MDQWPDLQGTPLLKVEIEIVGGQSSTGIVVVEKVMNLGKYLAIDILREILHH